MDKETEDSYLSVEEKLLYEVACNMHNTNYIISSSSLADDIDWDCFFKLSLLHNMFIASYRIVVNVLPKNILDQYRKLFIMNTIRANHIINESYNVMELINRNKLRACISKGFIFSQIIYGNPFIRQFSDVDIYTDDNDIYSIYSLLLNNDYHQNDVYTLPSSIVDKNELLRKELEKEITLLKMGLFPNTIEVKKRSDPLSKDIVADFLDHTILISVNNSYFRSFSIEHCFILLVLNTYKNYFMHWGIIHQMPLRDIVDIYSFFIRYPTLDYNAIINIITKYAVLNEFSEVLRVVSRVFIDSDVNKIIKLFDCGPSINPLSIFLNRTYQNIVRRSELIHAYYKNTINGMIPGDWSISVGKKLTEIPSEWIIERCPIKYSKIRIYIKISSNNELILKHYGLPSGIHLIFEYSFLKNSIEPNELFKKVIFNYYGTEAGGISTELFDCEVKQAEDGNGSFYLSIPITKNKGVLFECCGMKKLYISLYVHIFKKRNPLYSWVTVGWDHKLLEIYYIPFDEDLQVSQ